MEDRRPVRGALLRGLPIELVVEDGFDRAVGQRADLDGARWPRPQTRSAPNGRASRTMPRQARKPCSGWGRCSRISSQSAAVAGPIGRGVRADALDRPAGVAPVAGRHVLGDGRVLVIAARSQMGGDPLALEEDLDGAAGQPRLDLAAGEAIGHAVVMARRPRRDNRCRRGARAIRRRRRARSAMASAPADRALRAIAGA